MGNATTIATLRADALAIFQAGVAAADPFQAVQRCLHLNGNQLEILLDLNDPTAKRVGQWQKIHILAFGKAACAMADAAQQSLPTHLLAEKNLAVTNYENVTNLAHVEVLGAAHPLPDAAGLAAAQQCADLVSNAQAHELVLVLVSGGGSALIPYPVDSISLAEKIATTDLLLSCGASINQINCVRKHLSKLKGGGLARLAYPADVHALILSDVLGDDLSTIASGPTVPDHSTYADAIKVLEDHGVWDKTPLAVRKHLQQGQQGYIQETPKADDAIFMQSSHTLIGSNTVSLKASIVKAQDLGYVSTLYSGHLCGEAKAAATNLAIVAKHSQNQQANHRIAVLAGGETTVTIKGSGLGGRNQEMALAFSIAAHDLALSSPWVFLSAGTDGRDGPTDAAGGLIDPNSWERMLAAGENPQQLLANNDSYRALNSSKDLVITGATGTNVADLQVLLIQPTNSNI